MSELILPSIVRVSDKRFAFTKRMDPLEWAEEVYRLPTGGRFRWSYAPYTKGIFLSYFDRATIETVLEMYSRGLKSTTVLLLIGYLIDQAPRPILSLWPTNGNAELWSKDILTGELFDTTEPLHFLGSEHKKRTGENTLLHKTFPGGKITMFGANAPGDMRRAKGSLLYGEELDAIKRNLSDEGDPLSIFKKRGDEYPDTMRVWASYPSVKGLSNIDAMMAETDGNQWFSTCVRCGGEPYVMHRSMLRYDKSDLTTARMECPRCKELLTDAERYEMAHKQGDNLWRPQRDFKGKRGFHANAMLWPHPHDPLKYPGGFLQLLAQQEVDAEKAKDPKGARRVLINTVDAECYDASEDVEKPPEWKTIYARREKYTKVPLAGSILTAMVDVQKNRLEIEWRVWSRDGQSWGMGHTVIDGDVKDKDHWEKDLTAQLKTKFEREDGAQLALSMCFIDGGNWGDIVLAYISWLNKSNVAGVTGKVRATKGEGKAGHPIIDRRWLAVSKNLKGYHVGTWEAKDRINQALSMERNEDGSYPPGYMHYNQGYTEEYFQQLCTGIATLEFEVIEGKVQEVKKFLNKDRLKDEGLDLAVGNLAAFPLRNWQFSTIEQQLAEEAARLKKPEAKEEPQEKPFPVSPNRFVGVSGYRI